MSDLEIESIRPAHQGYRPDIQGLRALAVVLVILCHASVPHFGGGYIGVDIFFVISGFVITSLLLRQPREGVLRNLGHFYARRVRRILPASSLVLIATVIATYKWLGPITGGQLATDVRWASLFGANFHFISIAQNYFTQGQLSLITHYWSLSVEEQFYFVIPVLVFVTSAVVAVQRRFYALLGILGTFVIASSVWSVWETNHNPTTAYYSPFTRFWELALGGVIAVIATKWQGARVPAAVSTTVQWLALAGIVVSALYYTEGTNVPGWIMWGPCAAAALLLHPWGTHAQWSPSRLFSLRPVRYVGDISYSLYLYHYAWIMIPKIYALSPVSGTSRLLQVAGAAVCAVVSYHVLENPIRRSKKLDARPWLSVVIAVVAIGAVWLVAQLCQTYWTL